MAKARSRKVEPSRATEPGSAGQRAVSNQKGRMPGAVRSVMETTEVVSVGAVNVTKAALVTAVRGAEEVGTEVGTTAVNALRGSLRAAEEIGGDVGRIAAEAASGFLDAAGRIGAAAGRAVRNVVDETLNAARQPGRAQEPRKPLASAPGGRRQRRRVA